MFIYACARSLAHKRGLNYCLSDIEQLSDYFELSKQDYFLNTLKYLLFRIKNKIASNSYTFSHLQDNNVDHSFTLLNELSKNAWYYGYFQGIEYFKQNQIEIRKLFKIKYIHQKKYLNIIKKFSKEKPSLVIHIRLRDYKTFGPDYLMGPDLTIPFSYYNNLLAKYNLNNYNVIFTSDEIQTVKKNFNHIKNAYFSENEAIIDFQFIQNADITLLSPSTFAWWAAWLNPKSNKKIIVPKYFLGFKIKNEYPVNIILKNWTQIEVKLN